MTATARLLRQAQRDHQAAHLTLRDRTEIEGLVHSVSFRSVWVLAGDGDHVLRLSSVLDARLLSPTERALAGAFREPGE